MTRSGRRSFWQRIRAAFSRRDAAPAAVVHSAWKHNALVNLSVVDQERTVRNVDCRILGIRRQRIILHADEAQAMRLTDRSKCFLYFKLTPAVLRRELGFSSQPEQNGFLCRSTIAGLGPDAATGQISVLMPEEYTRRELRHHERYQLFDGMVVGATLEFMPLAPGPLAAAPVACARHDVRLLNISAGGARIVLDDVDFLDGFSHLEERGLILRLLLANGGGRAGQRHMALHCRCVGSHYTIRSRRLSILAQFLSQCPGQDSPSRDALPAASCPRVAGCGPDARASADGIPAIHDWTVSDYGRLRAACSPGAAAGV